MKYQWLESMVETGSIRKEAAESIYRECETLVSNSDSIIKEANVLAYKGGMGLPKKDMLSMQSLGPMILSSLMGQIIGSGVGWAKQKMNMSTLRSDLASSKEKILSQFPKDRAKASARFDEIVSYAPIVGMRPSLVSKIIQRTLHNGLSEDDAEQLISMHSSLSPSYDTVKELSKTGSDQASPIRMNVLGEIAADMVALVKTAAPAKQGYNFLSQYLPALAVMAGVPLMGSIATGGLNALQSKVKENALKKQLEKAYSKAMEMSDPDKEPLHANMEESRRAFETLAHFSPNVALQPQAARAFMNKLVSMGSNLGIQSGDLKDLTEIERNIANARGPDPFITGLSEGANVFGMGHSTGEAGRIMAKGLVEPMFGMGNAKGHRRKR